MAASGRIFGINGPIVYLAGDFGFQMNEMVYVGESRLVGEVIGLTSARTTIEVYEETTGLKPGEPVTGTGAPVSVTLAPGIITNIFDGIERPLSAIRASGGFYIDRGVHVSSLDTEKKWDAHITVKKGDYVYPGTVIAEVPETRAIIHKVMVPPSMEGYVLDAVSDGAYTIEEPLITLQKKDGSEVKIPMAQKWPIRVPRPVSRRYPASRPLITGQRIIDTLFPMAKGGTAAIPGGFGTGKTMMQHQIAKWSDADIIIYIGCGERGNEMTQVLEEFSELEDPKTGNPLMERTTLIANTSNMPVAAREASLYSGLTLAEYYRDLGRGVKGAFRPPRGNAGRRGLSGLSGIAALPVLRARRHGTELKRQRGLRLHHRRRFAPGRRLLRAGDAEYQAFRPLFLGTRQKPGLRKTFPRHPVAFQLFGVFERSWKLVRGTCG